MADQSVEQILAAARKRFKTKEINLGEGVKVTVRELPRKELRALTAKCCEVDEKGDVILFDKPGKGGTAITVGRGWRHVKDGIDEVREWLLAALTPAEAVDGLLGEDVPESVKDEIFEAARAINGESVASAAGN